MLPITAAEGLFYVFAFGLVAFASLVISTQRSMHSIFYLIATFLNAAGLLLVLGIEFLSFVIVIVYVGAVAVLFLFVVMMINITQEQKGKHWKQPMIFMASILGCEGVLLGGIIYLLPWRPLVEMQTQSNIKDLGRILYTEYFLAFQLVGLILFMAVIGAVLLTLRQRRHVHRQNISTQLKRSPHNSLELKDVDLGGGA
jgi:NADH-quinone oxidoreductase subunit J